MCRDCPGPLELAEAGRACELVTELVGIEMAMYVLVPGEASGDPRGRRG
jgi:hypothetical protein